MSRLVLKLDVPRELHNSLRGSTGAESSKSPRALVTGIVLRERCEGYVWYWVVLDKVRV